MKLIIKKSDKPEKEYLALFKEGNKIIKKTYFGDPVLSQYTSKKRPLVTEQQRQNYLSRHRRDLETEDSTRAGYLSYGLLWSGFSIPPSRSIRQNIKDYKQRFGYQ